MNLMTRIDEEEWPKFSKAILYGIILWTALCFLGYKCFEYFHAHPQTLLVLSVAGVTLLTIVYHGVRYWAKRVLYRAFHDHAVKYSVEHIDDDEDIFYPFHLWSDISGKLKHWTLAVLEEIGDFFPFLFDAGCIYIVLLCITFITGGWRILIGVTLGVLAFIVLTAITVECRRRNVVSTCLWEMLVWCCTPRL